MKLKNSDLDTFNSINRNKDIIIYGTGNNLKVLEYSKLAWIVNDIKYAVETECAIGKTVRFLQRELPVYSIQKLRGESNCIILITVQGYAYEIYSSLLELNLPDTVECYVFPMMLVEEKHLSEWEKKGNNPISAGDTENETKPKEIHSFWFSEEPISDFHKRCVDTWYQICGDYNITIWNLDNYKNIDNSFFKKAIEVGAWAYACDFARLDVIFKRGGIYMDMDVEIKKSLDPFFVQ